MPKKYKEDYKKRGRTVIADGGFHPGVPAAMVQDADIYFDQLKKANVSSYLGIKWNKFNVLPSTLEEFMHEIKIFNSTIFRIKKWKKYRFKNSG